MFNAFGSQASLFWLFTNHLDSRFLLAVDDLLLDMAEILEVNFVFDGLILLVDGGMFIPPAACCTISSSWFLIKCALALTKKKVALYLKLLSFVVAA